MRVITGKYKGRKLVAPKNDARPTLDRMKETLFDILGDKPINAVVLDLFAGSGQLAIECLSRGAAKAVLCDNSRDAVAAIRANFDKIGQKPNIVFGDFRNCLDGLEDRFDVIFVDPPYKSDFYLQVLNKICNRDLLKFDGIVVCEHSAEDVLPLAVGNLVCTKSRKIGTVEFDFYQRSEKCV